MIHGEIIHKEHYSDFYPKLHSVIKNSFGHVESGLQGDAWIWILDGKEKVALDTFSSMKFQIKSDKKAGSLLEAVIELIQKEFQLYLYDEPVIEGHEDIT
jgi:hypothetical protein